MAKRGKHAEVEQLLREHGASDPEEVFAERLQVMAEARRRAGKEPDVEVEALLKQLTDKLHPD